MAAWISTSCAPGQKERAIEHFGAPELQRVLDWPIVRRENMDGIKVYLGEIGWVMVRVSGTERMLRIYAETTRPETTQKILSGVNTLVRDSIIFTGLTYRGNPGTQYRPRENKCWLVPGSSASTPWQQTIRARR